MCIRFNVYFAQSKKALGVAQEDYIKQNSALMEDMPKLYEGRIDYFQPSFQALIKSQVSRPDQSNVFTCMKFKL